VKKGEKQPRVTHVKAMEWLGRAESGELPTDIAKKDGYDPRTVRNQIALTKKEHDEREARQAVLRNALTRHFADICSFAKKLERKITSMTEPFPIPDDPAGDPIWLSLKEHLPRSPLWKNLDMLKNEQAIFKESSDALEVKIEAEVTTRANTLDISDSGGKGSLEGWRDALLALAKLTARLGHDIEHVVYREEQIVDGVELFRGAYSLGIMPENRVEAVEKLFDDLLNDVLTSEEYALLKKNTVEFLRMQSSIKEELNRVILRRVVPGRCRYCPY